MKFTIAIPAYKSTFLKSCIDSILAQTYTDFEIVILNDCSPEPVEEIVQSYSDARIRYYKNPTNVGAKNVVNNWNKCLELAHGTYFMCMGDDDMLAPNCLEEYVNLINKYPNLNIYHARTMIIDEESKPVSLQEDAAGYESLYSLVWHNIVKDRLRYVGDFLYKTSILKERGGYVFRPYAWGSDYVTTYIAAEGTGIANSHVPTFLYRVNTRSITTNLHSKEAMDATMEAQKWQEEFVDRSTYNLEDEIYRQSLKRSLPSINSKIRVYSVANDLKSSWFTSLFFWIKNRKKYKLNGAMLLKACVIGFALKFI